MTAMLQANKRSPDHCLPPPGLFPLATMSRQHSPSPGHPPQHMHSNQPYQLHAVASSSSTMSNSNNNKAQQKSKGFAPGITASAEDVKYQTKYKELKRKVKEIELVCCGLTYSA